MLLKDWGILKGRSWVTYGLELPPAVFTGANMASDKQPIYQHVTLLWKHINGLSFPAYGINVEHQSSKSAWKQIKSLFLCLIMTIVYIYSLAPWLCLSQYTDDTCLIHHCSLYERWVIYSDTWINRAQDILDTSYLYVRYISFILILIQASSQKSLQKFQSSFSTCTLLFFYRSFIS